MVFEQTNRWVLQFSHRSPQHDFQALKSRFLICTSAIQSKQELRVHLVHFHQLGVLNITSTLVHTCTHEGNTITIH